MKNKVDTSYLFGFGQVSVITANTTFEINNKAITLPVIQLGYFTEMSDRKIGDTDKNQDVERISQLVFTNLESLEVLQRAIDHCRKQLETQK